MALDFAAGCIGGAAGTFCGYPLDTVKVRIQTQTASKNLKYTGTFQCFARIVREEGFRSLYRGMSSPLAGVAAMNALSFGVYGNVIRRMDNPDSVAAITTAGVSAGFVAAFVCSPMELVKTQMQVRGDGKGPFAVISEIAKSKPLGIRGLGKGLAITIAREVPACGVYFSSYELLVSLQKDNSAWVFCAGGFSGMLSWVVTYPQDVIKSRIQADKIGQGAKYKSYMHCLNHSIQTEGTGMLFRGISSTLIRAFPVNAITMGTVTLILRFMSEDAEISAYDAMSRLRINEGIIVTLPQPVEKYFAQRMRYHHNVVTRATDGPAIVQIEKPAFAVAPYRMYAENLLFATPTKYKQRDPKELEVGTLRSQIPLHAIMRLLDKLPLAGSAAAFQQVAFPLLSNSGNAGGDIDDFESELWSTAKYFSEFGGKQTDFVIEDSSPCSVIASDVTTTAEHKKEADILAPSILGNEQAQIQRRERITTSDFLLPTNLLSSSNDKIYGFYYVT